MEVATIVELKWSNEFLFTCDTVKQFNHCPHNHLRVQASLIGKEIKQPEIPKTEEVSEAIHLRQQNHSITVFHSTLPRNRSLCAHCVSRGSFATPASGSCTSSLSWCDALSCHVCRASYIRARGVSRTNRHKSALSQHWLWLCSLSQRPR